MARTRTNGFTLIEMLVVIVIIGILIGLSVPAVTTLMKSGGVSAATRHVSSTLSLARQYAITHRLYARVVFPYTASQPDMWYRTYAVVTNRDNTVAAGWGYVTKWEYLPPGAVFLNTTVMPGSGNGALDDPGSCKREAIRFPAASSPLPLTMLAYIEFSPTGAGSTPAILAITEGFVSGGGAPTLTGSNNLSTVSVDSLVGRIQVARP